MLTPCDGRRQVLLTILGFVSGLRLIPGVYGQAAAALAVLLVALFLQIRVRPYFFVEHNLLEMFLGSRGCLR